MLRSRSRRSQLFQYEHRTCHRRTLRLKGGDKTSEIVGDDTLLHTPVVEHLNLINCLDIFCLSLAFRNSGSEAESLEDSI